MQSPELLSIVVCTYNRLPLLRECLASLKRQVPTLENVEVIVVDNNCTDGTAEWVQNQIRDGFSGLKWVSEPKQGLSHARNRGMAEASGKYVAFLDDDGIADSGWVAGIRRTIEESDVSLAAFGGPYFPFYLDAKPEWFADRFGAWDGGRAVREYVGGECICGGNMVLKKEVLEKVGGFSPEFGMRGNVRSFGEESEVHLKIKRLGLKTLYSPHLPILHLVKPSQYIVTNLLRDSFRAGRNAGQLALVGNSKLVSFAKVIVTVALFPYYFFGNGNAPFKTRVLDGTLPLYRRWGYFRGLFDR